MTDISTPVHIVAPYISQHNIRITDKESGRLLVDWLSQRFPFRSRDNWQGRIDTGFIHVNGTVGTNHRVLCTGDSITLVNPRVVEPAVPDKIRMIDDQPDYLVVDKPAPMPVHPGGRYNKNSLVRLLEARGYRSLKIVHRLDAVTSGILLLAKTVDFAKHATSLFSEGKVRKKYIAVVRGVPAEDEVEINQPIRRKCGHVFEWHHDHQAGKQAISRFRVIKRLQDRAIVSCTPITGRTHQLRLHLQFWGHPVIDDPLYASAFSKPHHAPQRRAISLRHVHLDIPALGVDYHVNPYITIESDSSEIVSIPS